jgi:hypothetical protein
VARFGALVRDEKIILAGGGQSARDQGACRGDKAVAYDGVLTDAAPRTAPASPAIS